MQLLQLKPSPFRKIIITTFWILFISWIFAFTSFSIFDKNENEISFGIATLIFTMLPACISIIINFREGGNWQDLCFFKPKKQDAILAFLTPIIYITAILTLQYFLDVRSTVNWDKQGSIYEMVFGLVLGYPIMFILIAGEEIGWRGYLQEKLVTVFGGLKGLFILGLIWGIWHLPLSLQGHNLPNNPLLETFITTPLMCIALSIMIGFYGLNKKSIFIGLLLHSSNNHFAGTLLYLSDTKDEVLHATTFSVMYIIMIILFGYLYQKKFKSSDHNN